MEANTSGNYYCINHISLFTGLTDRTIRSHLATGILQGEKINGVWHFTPEQVDAYIRHPAVKPSIQAKNNALVYDFMLETKRSAPEICTILDLPGNDRKDAAEFFCHAINNGEYRNIRFSFSTLNGIPRVILKGNAQEVLSLTNAYFNE